MSDLLTFFSAISSGLRTFENVRPSTEPSRVAPFFFAGYLTAPAAFSQALLRQRRQETTKMSFGGRGRGFGGRSPGRGGRFGGRGGRGGRGRGEEGPPDEVVGEFCVLEDLVPI